jgi:cytochrome c
LADGFRPGPQQLTGVVSLSWNDPDRITAEAGMPGVLIAIVTVRRASSGFLQGGLLALSLPVCSVIGCPRAQAVDLEAARQKFLKGCGTCHALSHSERGRQGPNLDGLYGRVVGSRADFSYSDALRGGGWVCDAASFDRWIENAQEVRPGTTMTDSQADPEKRALVIESLKSQTAGASVAGKP